MQRPQYYLRIYLVKFVTSAKENMFSSFVCLSVSDFMQKLTNGFA